MKKNREIPILESIFVGDSSENLSKTEETRAEVIKHTDKISNNNQQHPVGILKELKVKKLNKE